MDDYTLVRQSLDGDDEAFRRLHDKYFHSIYRYAVTQLKDKEQAKDLTQEVFIKVARHLSKYKGKSSFKTWLFTIARNTVIDFHRKNKRNKNIVSIEEEALELLYNTAKKNFGNDYKSECHLEILDCLQQLPQHHQTVIHLRFIEGFSIEETAKVMSKTKAAVKTIQWRAMKNIKDFMLEGVNEYESS